MDEFELKVKPERDDQFSDQHSLKLFNQSLFGIHTSDGNAGQNSGIGDWVKEFTDDEIPAGATVAVSQDNYLIGSIRFPAGSFGNYYDWASEYVGGTGGIYKEIFQKDSIYPTIVDSISTYGHPKQYPIASFVDYAKNYLPDSQIHIMMNVYTQSVAEIKTAIDKFKTILDDNTRVINWEMGNEFSGGEYEDLANDAAEPGSFANLSGADLTKAFEYYPEGRYSVSINARKTAQVCKYIRDNYPDDKIGLTGNNIPRWANPIGGPGYLTGFTERSIFWAKTHRDNIPDDHYDAIICHPYLTPNQTMFDSLAADAIPASGKELDVSFSDQEDKIWRFIVTQGQEYTRFTMDSMRELWPSNKEIWFTEWGLLMSAFDTLVVPEGTCGTPALNKLLDTGADFTDVEVDDRVLNKNTGLQAAVTVKDSTTLLTLDADIFQTLGHGYKISTKNQPTSMAGPDQYIIRSLFLASSFVSMAEQNIKWSGRTTLSTSMYHTLLRGSSNTSTNFFTGYFNANGCTFALLRKTVNDMTEMAVPILNDAGVVFDGQDPLTLTKIHPVRAIFFTDGSIQRMFIINVSPTARTVEIPFATSSGRKLEASSSPADPFEQIADATYATYTDLAASTVASTSMTLAPFSIHSLVNTGALVDLDNFIMVVT